MPAQTKSELQAVTQKEYAKLAKFIDSIDADSAIQKQADDTSIKDVITHRAHWIDLFLGWYADGLAGKTVHFPAEGYKWSDLKRYNADLRQEQAGLSWQDAKAMLVDRHATICEFIEKLSESELYGAPMKGGRNAWTTGRWIEAAAPSHYRSASKFIRAAIRGKS